MSRHWKAEQVYINAHLSQMWPKALDSTIPEALSLALQLDALSDSYFSLYWLELNFDCKQRTPKLFILKAVSVNSK